MKKGQLKFILVSVIIALVVLGILLAVGKKAQRAEGILGEQMPEQCPYYGKSTEEFRNKIVEDVMKNRNNDAYSWYRRFKECQDSGYLLHDEIALEEGILTESILNGFEKKYESETS